MTFNLVQLAQEMLDDHYGHSPSQARSVFPCIEQPVSRA